MEAGIRVAALSVDDEQHATETVGRHRLDIPVGYGADALVVAAARQSYDVLGLVRYAQMAA